MAAFADPSAHEGDAAQKARKIAVTLVADLQ
jgi:hypothetical protein